MHLLIARKGTVEILEAPDPIPAPQEVLLQTHFSTLSPGTELEALTQGSSSFLALLRKGLRSWDKIRRSLASGGFFKTFQKIEASMEQAIPLGYSVSGKVVAMGSEVRHLQVGDWAVAVGPGAYHGTLACVPHLMTAKLNRPELAGPASTAALACIGLHALHRAELSAGEETAVIGLGIIGQLTQQVLRASGHRVVAFDPIESRRQEAALCGTEAFDPSTFEFDSGPRLTSHQEGFDAVFICAKSNHADVIQNAAKLCRKRGKMIIIGEFPIQVSRELLYSKELELRISAAYGDGRYDPLYATLEEDYPVAQNRWSVRRNLDLFVRWLEEGRLNTAGLLSTMTRFEEAPGFYAQIRESRATLHHLSYASTPAVLRKSPIIPLLLSTGKAEGLCLVGAGQFTQGTHLNNLSKIADQFQVRRIVGKTPATLAMLSKKLGVPASCEIQDAFADTSISSLLIATPHKLHGEQTLRALEAGKHVFIEKPLGLKLHELEQIEKFYTASSSSPVLFVGFNRRFAPLSKKLAEERRKIAGGIEIRYQFIATPIPNSSWLMDPSQGSRFVGEVCHAVDWVSWYVGAPVTSKQVIPNLQRGADLFLTFADGSRAHLDYQQLDQWNGPKEQIQISSGNRMFALYNFLSLDVYELGRKISHDDFQSKGHMEILQAFASAIANPAPGPDPYGFIASSKLTLELDAAIRSNPGP